MSSGELVGFILQMSRVRASREVYFTDKSSLACTMNAASYGSVERLISLDAWRAENNLFSVRFNRIIGPIVHALITNAMVIHTLSKMITRKRKTMNSK